MVLGSHGGQTSTVIPYPKVFNFSDSCTFAFPHESGHVPTSARLDEQKHQQEQKDDNGRDSYHHEPEAATQERQEQRTEGIGSCL